MNKEDLYLLRRKLDRLNELEKKQRDIYLRNLNKGRLQGPLTGYNSIDKPWLKYYKESDIEGDAPSLTCFENLLFHNIDKLDETAYEYLGRSYTYEEFFNQIDEAASAFTKMGVKKGDIVTICSITTPEVLATFFALNKIGAISNMVDVRYTEKAIEGYIKEANSKYLVTLDLCLPKIEKIIDKTGIDKVVSIRPTLGANKKLDTLAKLGNRKYNKYYKKDKIIEWNKFIEDGFNASYKTFGYRKNAVASIVHTGGTTGVPKGVMLTNDNFNNVAYQLERAGAKSHRGWRFLNIMPPFIAYGIGLGLYTPLVLGWHTIIVPKFDPENFDKLLDKYKPNGVMGVPTYFENVMKSKKIKNKDLSYLTDILLGGDRTSPEFEKRLTTYLKDHNCNATVEKGYSMTEASAAATFSALANKDNSVGIPLVKTTIKIVKPGTDEEIYGYNEVGEVCINTKTMMKGYYNKEIDTSNVKKRHVDGFYIHSGDLGYMDKDGLVYIKDRIKRMIIRSGFKVFPSEIENLFITHPYIESVAVVAKEDNVDIHAPKACIVLKDNVNVDKEQIINELKLMLQESDLPPYFEPVEYDFLESLPKTDIGKIDFKALENEENIKKLIRK